MIYPASIILLVHFYLIRRENVLILNGMRGMISRFWQATTLWRIRASRHTANAVLHIYGRLQCSAPRAAQIVLELGLRISLALLTSSAKRNLRCIRPLVDWVRVRSQPRPMPYWNTSSELASCQSPTSSLSFTLTSP